MPTEYTLNDLAKLTGVSTRTVRYYIQSGLLPAPTGSGPGARYSEGHLERLRLIRKLQASHLPLAEIRRRLETLPDEEVARAADDAAAHGVSDSALEYVNALLYADEPALQRGDLAFAPPAPAAVEPPVALPKSSGPAPSAPLPEPERVQWERISLDPDIEIHVRRPLSRLQNKRVERLVSIARQLLEED